MNKRKKRAMLCIVMIALMWVAGCGGEPEAEPVDIAAAAEALAAGGSYDDVLTRVDDGIALSFYGISGEDISECCVYMSTGATAEEAAAFRAASEEAAVRVKQAVEERVASQTKIYAQYAPGEVAKLEAACIETREDGWVVLLCVSADSARAAELMAEL